MKRLSAIEFEQLKRGAAVLSVDEHGEKVLQAPDGRIIKLFRRKRLLSSALLWPYAVRFFDAARELNRLGVPSVEVLDVFRVPAIHRDGVTYRKLEGVELRELLRTQPVRTEHLLEQLAKFLATLHRHGVYFRAIHFGNVLVQQGGDGSMALIDVSEARFRRGSLKASERIRNFRPLRSYHVDAAALARFGFDRFISAYLEAAQIDDSKRARFAAAAEGILRESPHRSGH